jgi:hypothetical protein
LAVFSDLFKTKTRKKTQRYAFGRKERSMGKEGIFLVTDKVWLLFCTLKVHFSDSRCP